jgi:hypothetical protein
VRIVSQLVIFPLTMLAACADGRHGTASPDLSGTSGTDAASGACGQADYLLHASAGADGNWRTEDDALSERQTWSFSTIFELQRWVQYQAPGPDGQWVTGDDVIAQWNDYKVDKPNQRLTITTYTAAGADATWLTGDDHANQRIVLDGYDGDTYTGGTAYDSPGTDGVWGSADDVVGSYYVVKSTAGASTQLLYDTGADGIPHTADDRVVARSDFGANNNGTVVVKYYAGAGADGVFGSDDDPLATVTIVQCDYGVLTNYGDAGPDGTWLTSDDTVSSMLVLTAGTPCLNLCKTIVL